MDRIRQALADVLNGADWEYKRMRGLLPVHVAVAAVLAATSSVVMAQETTSSVRGSVVSDSGGAIPGATVTVVHTPSGTTRTSTTNSVGAFSTPGLRPGGPYTITVTASGYGEASLKDVYLGVGEPLALLPLALRASGELEEVVVSGQTTTQLAAGPTTVLDREDVEGVASVNRDIRDVARHDPFASFNPTTRGVQIAGTNNRTNKFSVDGLNFSDSFGLNQGGMPTTRGPVPMDAVEQLSVKVAPYDITEGDFQGGSINVVLRSGGNELTGSAFYSYTDDKLTGDKSRGTGINLDFSSKDWGAFVSGPIIENKLFFALAYENLAQGNPADVGLVGAPTPIPTITQAQVDQVSAIAQSVYGYDTRGLRTTLPEKDKKYTMKVDWNVTDFHRLSYTGIFQNTYQQSTSSGSFSTTSPSINYQAYATNEPERVNSSALQLNSQWTDAFSTEARLNFRNYSKIPSSLGLAGFPQVQVCLDATDTGAFNQCSQNGTGRLFFGVEQFSQADVVKAEQKGAEFVARLSLGDHSLKAQAAYSKTNITNVFVQSALGVYYFDSLAAFQSRNASQLVNWQYSITGNIDDVSASFDYDQYTLGLQDSWNILPGLDVTYGLRADFYKMTDRPPENSFFVSRYGFSNTLTIDGNSVLQPRVNVTWKPEFLLGLTVRGGFGLFNGGSPVVFLGNSFSVAGVYSNSISATRTATGCTGVPAALCADALNNVGGTPLAQRTALFNYLSTNTGALSAAPVNGMTPDFKLPATWKANVSLDYATDLGVLGSGWNFGADVYRTFVKQAAQYTDLRVRQVGTAPDGRPIYAENYTGGSANSDLLMSNTGRGQSTIVVGRIDKEWDFGLGVGFSYANQNVKSLSDMTTSTYASGGSTGTGTYGGSPMFDPNRSAYGTSIYEIKHNYKLNLDFKKTFFGDFETRFALFGELRSGTPYNLGMQTASTNGRSTLFGTIQSTGSTDRRYLLYVPDVSSQTADPRVSYSSTAVYNAFRDYVVAEGLTQGAVVEKNSKRSPDFFKVDLHLEQEVPFFGASRIKLFADVENLLNLLDDKWGSFRYYDPLQSIVTAACAATSGASCTRYTYSNFTAPAVRTDGRLGLWNLRLGFRVEF